jgi:hypothetical protein
MMRAKRPFDQLRRRIRRWALPPVRNRLDPVACARVKKAALLAGQQLGAADVLGRAPHRAESMALLARAASTLENAFRDLGQASSAMVGHPSTSIADVTIRSLRSARESLAAAPGLDVELSRQHVKLWRRSRRLVRSALSDLRVATRGRRAVVLRRAATVLGFVVAVALILAAAVAARRLHDRFEVGASDSYAAGESDSSFEADNAVDGDPATEWLTPNGQGGWLELRFARPTRVSAVRVVNAHNAPFNDRAARELNVELYRDDHLERRTQTVFDEIAITTEARIVPIEADGVTRVRFVVVTFHGLGGGMAEVEVIEEERQR